mgnify:CR=1 FL=1
MIDALAMKDKIGEDSPTFTSNLFINLHDIYQEIPL